MPRLKKTQELGDEDGDVTAVLARDRHAACCTNGICHCREAELQEQAEQYRSIFEATSDALIISDLDGFAVEVNPAACAMYGYTYEEFIGLHRTAFVHPGSHHLIEESIQAAKKGGSMQFQAVDVRKDGRPFHVEGRGTRFTFRGEPHLLAVVRDVTERVWAEQAVQEERQRLSRELHDSVSQALHGIHIGAHTTDLLLDQDPQKARESNEYVRSLAKTGLAEIRALIFDLRPETLEQEGLEGALRRQGTALESRHGIAVDISVDGESDVPMPVKEAIYRIAQEAMHNTVKHAEAQAISLSLHCRDGECILEIRDDGRGFNAGGSHPGHLGLHSMRERATRVGGTLEVESAPGRGTVISARLPRASGVSGS